MQFIGQSLPAHHFFYGTVRIFTLSHIVSQAVFYNWKLNQHGYDQCPVHYHQVKLFFVVFRIDILLFHKSTCTHFSPLEYVCVLFQYNLYVYYTHIKCFCICN